MEMYRSYWGRRELTEVKVEAYAEADKLFGRIPLVLFLGDFLQQKQVRQLSLVDDLLEKAVDDK